MEGTNDNSTIKWTEYKILETGQNVRYCVYNHHMLDTQDLLQLLNEITVETEWEKLIIYTVLYLNLFEGKSDVEITKDNLQQGIKFLQLKVNTQRTCLQYQSKLKTLYEDKLNQLDEFLKYYQYILNQVKQELHIDDSIDVLIDIGDLWQQKQNKK